MRGIAALLVFISHLPLEMTYEHCFVIGRFGVSAFFLISGYLSVSSRYKMNGKQYAFNRFIRIYPISWLLIFLVCLCRFDNGLPYRCIIANLTLFQQFLGQPNLIGASWMLPIQITFFMIIAIFGMGKIGENKKCRLILVLICGILAVGVAILRFLTNKPFPTAFFLLIMLGFLGMYFKQKDDAVLSDKELYILISIFEVSLAIAVYLSYPGMFIHYIGAYNGGLLIFVAAKVINLDLLPFKKLGEIGFTFFMGAEIPYMMVTRGVDLSSTLSLRILGCFIEFILAIIFAYVVTKYIEIPLRNKMKIIGKKLL